MVKVISYEGVAERGWGGIPRHSSLEKWEGKTDKAVEKPQRE